MYISIIITILFFTFTLGYQLSDLVHTVQSQVSDQYMWYFASYQDWCVQLLGV